MDNKYLHRMCLTVGLVVALVGAGCSRTAKESRHLTRAQKYYEAGQFEKAEIEYLNVMRLNFTNGVARARLARIYYDRGDVRRAFPALVTAVKADPEDGELRLKLGTLYLAVRQFDKAREEALQVLSKRPLTGEAMILLADAAQTTNDVGAARQRLSQLPKEATSQAGFHVAQGSLFARERRLSAAETALKQAQTIDPKTTSIQLRLGNVYWAQGRLAEAGKTFAGASEGTSFKSAERQRWVDFKLRTGDTAGAKRILHEQMEKAPDFATPFVTLAQISFDAKQIEEAAELVKKALQIEPRNYDGMFLNARLQLAQGQITNGIIELERVIAQHGRIPNVQYELAVAHVRNRDIPKAEALLKQVTDADPDFAEAILLRATLDISRGEFTPAVTSIQELIKRKPSPRAYLLLASAYRTRGTPKDALGVYRTLASLAPTNAQVPFLMGTLFREQRDAVNARQAFEKAIQIAPAYYAAVLQLIDLDAVEGRYPEAMRRAQSLAQRLPEAPEPLFAMARIHALQKDTAKAEALLEQMLQKHPDYRAAHLELARLYITSGRTEAARLKWEGELKKNPRDAQSLLQLALLDENRGEFGKAAESYDKILHIQPKFVVALNNLAYIHAEHLGKMDAAYEHARKARELAPNDPSIADTLGWVLYRRGDYSGAIELLQDASEKLPTVAEVHYHLGAAYGMIGQEQAARVALQRALQSEGVFPSREKARARLGLLEEGDTKLDAAQAEALMKHVTQEPNDLLAVKRLGAYYERTGSAEKAVQLYENGLARSPGTVWLLVRLAQAYAQRGDEVRAMEKARAARALVPQDVETGFVLADAAFRSGEYKWVLEVLHECDRQEPNRADLLVRLGQAHFALGQIAEAEAVLQDAISRKSTADMEAGQRLLEIIGWYRKPQELASVQPHLDAILKTDPNYSPALLLVGMQHETRGATQEAKEMYEKILRNDRSFVPVQRRLAILSLKKLNDSKRAFELASKARVSLPEDPELAEIMGRALFEQRDYAAALRFLRESARGNPSDGEVFFYIGRTHYQLKDKVDGREAFKRALELNPEAPFAPEAKRLMAELN